MPKEAVWPCPKCQTNMSPGTSVLLHDWHCTACGVDWVSGEAVAAFLPTVKAFEKLRAAAASGELPTRMLQCPTCRTRPMRLVRVDGVVIDVCRKCVGVALDPGELSAFKAHGQRAQRSVEAIDVITGLDALVQILSVFH
jgi:Zn-finger nucleic acid-binding protein